jgi:hypothetical protein
MVWRTPGDRLSFMRIESARIAEMGVAEGWPAALQTLAGRKYKVG